MDQNAFEAYRKSRYEPALAWYDAKAQHNQRSYRRMQLVLVISAALTPVFIGCEFLIPHEYEWFKMIPLTTSGIVAAATAMQGTFKFQELWMNYRSTCELLRREIYLYQARREEYAGAGSPEAVFVGRVEALIGRETDQWQHVVKDAQVPKASHGH